MASLTKRKSEENTMKLQLVVCEYHQDVIQFIHRFIARKKLPFQGIKMVHLDSHPDLAYPEHLLADDCFHKGTLYDQLDIADWILPLMYQGHLRDLIWVRPPWAEQIDNLETPFKIGKDRSSGKLKVTCTEDYFMEDGMYSTEESLDNIQNVNLKVTLIECLTKELQQQQQQQQQQGSDVERSSKMMKIANASENDENRCKTGAFDLVTKTELSSGNDTRSRRNSRDCEFNLTDDRTNLESEENKNKKTIELNAQPITEKQELKGEEQKNTDFFTKKGVNRHSTTYFPSDGERYILDIDLDYFSVTNPFLQDYTEEEYKELKRIYHIDLPTNKNDKVELTNFVERSTKKLQSLKKTIQKFASGKQPIEIKENEELVDFLVRLKMRRKNVEEDEWNLVHSAGMTTELPHHVSSDTTIDQMLNKLEKLIHVLPRPTLVTVARSAIDEYCPPDQVDSIEKKVVDLLSSRYQNVEVHYDYKDEARLL